MANDYFKFKQFSVFQHHCAMKVGTDGTLLGAWAEGGKRIVDVGTGTGLIALMMAQRFPDASVLGIDIDEMAVRQAMENVALSPFAARIDIELCDMALLQGRFDSIVCNPPFFVDSLLCPDERRTKARHAETLTYRQLMSAAWRLLDDGGQLSVVIPFDCRQRLEAEAFLAGFAKVRQCGVKTTPAKPAKRFLLAFAKHSAEVETTELVIGSEEYNKLTSDFYL